MSTPGPGPLDPRPPAAATAVALKALIGSARRQLERGQPIAADTLDAIDTLYDALIDQLPFDLYRAR